ncbi:S-adenosylmethionine decarboxylase [Mesorhizobium delmotii]|uniref:Uncharacterized protein n=1 Tax=Mesorhizobium delmotii TaxID=1631247 RepID=A0A2P9AQ97_9HYPH|nr:S-adenosylmethionine decarboxylase [Mesorhizobium delmotii]SJM33309.1 hypothetical protein BQ8482_340205 [Mesorhizobium delmotii]
MVDPSGTLGISSSRVGSATDDEYGIELLLDLHGCDVATFNRGSLDAYFTGICDVIKMERCDVHFWDDINVAPENMSTEPKTKGTSAVCFIITSTIVVHTLDLLGTAYINIFSCKQFDSKVAEEFTTSWFSGRCVKRNLIVRV